MHRALRNGKQPGRIPYGYDIAEDGCFCVVEEEAAIIREIISNIAGGSTLYKEVQRLNGLGVPGPGWKYRGRPRRHSGGWSLATISNIVHQSAYGGMHRVRINDGKGSVERECPPVVPSELQQQALSRLVENKRWSKRASDRGYLLSGLIRCAVCGSAFVSHPTKSRGGKKRYYYKCNDDRPDKRHKAEKGHAPYVHAVWIEDLVWQDVKGFLRDPGEVLQRLKEHVTDDEEIGALEQRRENLQKRLRNKHTEKDRYIKLYAHGHIDDSELATYLQDVNLQSDNLRLLLGSVEAELSEKSEQRQVAETTGAWLSALRERTAEVEADTEEAYATRKELVRLLVEAVVVDRNEDGKTRVRITYRFGPPADGQGTNPGSEDVDTLGNSTEFLSTSRYSASIRAFSSSNRRSSMTLL